ncbi:MAG: hypothetical protein ACUVWV_03255 [Thermodesulfobacteriota bacterium]
MVGREEIKVDKSSPLSADREIEEAERLLASVEVKEEDAANFSPDLIYDWQEQLTDEQRQNLYQKIIKMSIPQKIRLAMVGNREARNILILDHNKAVVMAVLRSPKLTENDVFTFAQQRNLSEEVYKYIARNKHWIKNYALKLALVNNPKTPLPIALRFLDHLQERDLKNLSRSKNVSNVLAKAAGQLLLKRAGK